MYSRIVTIQNNTGLHARPASEFVRAAGNYRSKITIGRVGDETRANAKSIIFVLGLALARGSRVEIAAEGEDEKEAADTLAALVESGFADL